MMNYKVQDKCSKGSIVVDLSSSDFSFVVHLFLLLSITSFFSCSILQHCDIQLKFILRIFILL